MSKIFDIEPVSVVCVGGEEVLVVPDGDIDSDHLYSRAKNYQILEHGTEALQIAMKISRESENPRAIEVLSGLMKTLSDVSKNLVTLNKDKTDAKGAKGIKNNTPTIGVQNIVFSGSSKDLNRIISEQGKLQ